MVRPEGNKALDKRAIARDARVERNAGFASRQLDETTSRLPALRPVSRARHSKRSESVPNRRGRGSREAGCRVPSSRCSVAAVEL